MPDEPSTTVPAARAGLIAVVGRANAGKSTLVNAVVGEKVSIVSSVVQTTRNMIRAVLSEPRGQLAFMDTPGVHRATHDLGKVMNRMARASIEGSDIALLVLDASHPPHEEDEGWIRRLLKEEIPVVAVLNKSDQKHYDTKPFRRLWTQLAQEKNVDRRPHWERVSALTGKGVSRLVDYLFENVPEGPPLFPEDVLTDFPRKLAFADVVREKLNGLLKQELPHSIAVEIERIDEKSEGLHASGSVIVEKHSQKGIVIGKNGRLLKRARKEAEQDLSTMYDTPVSLELWVKVHPKWQRNHWILKRLGYVP